MDRQHDKIENFIQKIREALRVSVKEKQSVNHSFRVNLNSGGVTGTVHKSERKM